MLLRSPQHGCNAGEVVAKRSYACRWWITCARREVASRAECVDARQIVLWQVKGVGSLAQGNGANLPQAWHLQLARVAVTGHNPLTLDLCEAADTSWSLLGSVSCLDRQERALLHEACIPPLAYQYSWLSAPASDCTFSTNAALTTHLLVLSYCLQQLPHGRLLSHGVNRRDGHVTVSSLQTCMATSP